MRQATAQPARLGSAGGRSPVFRIAAYEGPLDLLLHLLKRAEVDVRDLPVSSITAQYLEHLQALEALGLDVAAEYLVMAATLVLIKSIALLPNPEPEELATEAIEELEAAVSGLNNIMALLENGNDAATIVSSSEKA